MLDTTLSLTVHVIDRAHALQFCSACAWCSTFCGAADATVHGRTVEHPSPPEEGTLLVRQCKSQKSSGVYSMLMLVARAEMASCLSLDV
jgi:hypothetical protein